jgi:hypothetical protein
VEAEGSRRGSRQTFASHLPLDRFFRGYSALSGKNVYKHPTRKSRQGGDVDESKDGIEDGGLSELGRLQNANALAFIDRVEVGVPGRLGVSSVGHLLGPRSAAHLGDVAVGVQRVSDTGL